MPEQALAYERQPGESPEAFRAFTIYRDLGHQRTLQEVDRRLRLGKEAGGASAVLRFPDASKEHQKGTSPKRKAKPGHIGLWSRKFEWVSRVAEWDALLDRHIRDKQLDDIERMARRQAQQAQLLSDVLMRPVVELAQTLQDPDKLATVAGILDPMAPIAKLLVAPAMRELWELANAAAHKLPKLHEAERYARGVRVLDSKDGTTQGGTAVWDMVVYQPPREGPEPDFTLLDNPEREEWDGDKKPVRRRGEDDE